MMELLKNAWAGWLQFTSGGKVMALLLVALLVYWLGNTREKKRFATFAKYTTIMTVCCICPLTAAVLMGYQTRFYDYQWIWNLVPVTIFVALIGTELWVQLTEKYVGQKKRHWQSVLLTFAMIALVCLSGGMGNTSWEPDEEDAKRRETALVLEGLRREEQGTVKLWAPQSIMEYARALDGSILLPYGRNMWDISLNAYAYDVYGIHEEDLYAWMCNAEAYGTGEVDCVDLAAELGVTHILLPANMQSEVVEELERYLHEKAEKIEGYYLFCL